MALLVPVLTGWDRVGVQEKGTADREGSCWALGGSEPALLPSAASWPWDPFAHRHSPSSLNHFGHSHFPFQPNQLPTQDHPSSLLGGHPAPSLGPATTGQHHPLPSHAMGLSAVTPVPSARQAGAHAPDWPSAGIGRARYVALLRDSSALRQEFPRPPPLAPASPGYTLYMAPVCACYQYCELALTVKSPLPPVPSPPTQGLPQTTRDIPEFSVRDPKSAPPTKAAPISPLLLLASVSLHERRLPGTVSWAHLLCSV